MSPQCDDMEVVGDLMELLWWHVGPASCFLEFLRGGVGSKENSQERNWEGKEWMGPQCWARHPHRNQSTRLEAETRM